MVSTLRQHTTGWLFTAFLIGRLATSACAQTADACIAPAAPVLKSDRTDICRGESAVLSATGCTGTIIWSTGETGPQITVQPTQNTRYTALCRSAQGCLSCFADVVTIRINTPRPPLVTPSASPVSAGDQVTLTASGCAGTVSWPDGTTGLTTTLRINETTTFGGAICTVNGCPSVGSVPVQLLVATPTRPVVTAAKSAVCFGTTTTLTASNCLGVVRWSNGLSGATIASNLNATQTYRAVCQVGSARSDSSEAVTVRVLPAQFTPVVKQRTFTNRCPFQTIDLTQAIPADPSANPSGQWLFRYTQDPNGSDVKSPMAAGPGSYFLYLKTNDGCFSGAVPIQAERTPCQDGIAPCISNPPRVVAWTDSLNAERQSVVLQARIGGDVEELTWSTTGSGLLTDPKRVPSRYLFSEADRQRGSVVFALTTPDPDGSGPCVGALASLTVAVPRADNALREIVGLSKKVFEPVWLENGEVELTYHMTVKNGGQYDLSNIQVTDDLAEAFTASGAKVKAVVVNEFNGFRVDPTYTGIAPNTNLLARGQTLPSGGVLGVRLRVRLNVGEARTLTFSNQAQVQAVDKNGALCRDLSTNGDNPDPDSNGNPADNDEPTVITLQSVSPEGTVFIPEGFSPNGDGINDQFVVSRVPTNTTVQLKVYNRWGSLVYASDNYRNDWSGTSNQGGVGPKGQGLPEGTYFYTVRLSDGREYTRFLTLSR